MLPDVDEATTLDRLAGDWHVHQLKGGHRFSADDMITAWVAAETCPDAQRLLDLGAGIGSVGLMTLWRMDPSARLVMVEVQQVSHQLARHSICHNGLEARVDARLGDLRDPSSVPDGPVFDLITGSPPYMPLGNGVVSPHPQRAGARVELRGTIHDYAEAAARSLAPDGTFVVCFAARDPRAEAAVAAAGLHLRRRLDVVFRTGDAPMICVLVAGHAPCTTERGPPLVVRDATGQITPAYVRLRRSMGNPVDVW